MSGVFNMLMIGQTVIPPIYYTSNNYPTDSFEVYSSNASFGGAQILNRPLEIYASNASFNNANLVVTVSYGSYNNAKSEIYASNSNFGNANLIIAASYGSYNIKTDIYTSNASFGSASLT